MQMKMSWKKKHMQFKLKVGQIWGIIIYMYCLILILKLHLSDFTNLYVWVLVFQFMPTPQYLKLLLPNEWVCSTLTYVLLFQHRRVKSILEIDYWFSQIHVFTSVSSPPIYLNRSFFNSRVQSILENHGKI